MKDATKEHKMSNAELSETNPSAAPMSSAGRKHVWMRGLMMVLIALMIGAAQSVLFLAALVQFVLMLVDKGQPNVQLANFGEMIGKWLAKAAQFQTAKTEDKPWPFSPLN
jgi:succinate-acetate transporter protein